MMAQRFLVVALLGALAAAGALALTPAKPAAACSFVPERPTIEEMADGAEMVIVGEVVDEHPMELAGAQESLATYEPSESTVAVVAALKRHPRSEITLSFLGFLAPDCAGGPPLAAGERVLLFLSEHRGEFRKLRGELGVYGHTDGKYVLTEGEASRSRFRPTPVSGESVLQRVAATTGAAQDEFDAALAFANGESVPIREVENGNLPLLIIGLGAQGAAVLLAALFFAVRRLRRAG